MQRQGLTFKSISHFKAGILVSLLNQCYASLLSTEPSIWQDEAINWKEFDQEVFENPDTVGRCVFITCLGEKVIGFGSYDPRQKPDLGIIGHNCIVPKHQGHGYGKMQVLEILDQFKKRGITNARVVTSEHPFFLPARKMYLACQFQEIRRLAGGPDPRYKNIEYKKGLV